MYDLKQYKEIRNQNHLDELLTQVGSFHDGLIKECHMVNDAYVDEKLMMHCDFNYHVRLLIQRQYHRSSAIEMIFLNIQTFKLRHDDNATDIIMETEGKVEGDDRHDCRMISLDFGEVKISSRNLYYRDVSQWMGKEIRY